MVQSWIDKPDLLPTLAEALHKHGMTLMVEIPALKGNSTGKMGYELERAIMTAVVFWAELGVDGISILGLETFSGDPFLPGNIQTWKAKFNQYGSSPNTKILCGPSLLPHNIEMISPRVEGSDTSPAFVGIQSLGLLDATVKVGTDELNESIIETVDAATKWDLAPSQPWIHWSVEGDQEELSNAEMAFLMFLPGTVSLQVLPQENEELVRRFTSIRAAAVPVFMNGNYKKCHGHCTSYKEKEINHAVHVKENGLVFIERHFSRRHRFMVITNMGSANVSLSNISSLYTGGDVILDTSNLEREESYVGFRDLILSAMQAYVIKFPK